MNRVLVFVLAYFLSTASFAKEQAPLFDTDAIAFLTNEQDMSRRLGGSAIEFSEYLKQLKLAGVIFVSSMNEAPKVNGAYVVIIKPGKRSKILVHTLGKEPNQEFINGLSTALQSVEPPVVLEGPIALSISFRTWPKGSFPFPYVGVSALYRAIDNAPESASAETLIELAWPDDDG
jgi:hypothetical protein